MPDERSAATTVPDRATCRTQNQVVDAIRSARNDRAPLRIRGGATWLRAGAPVTATRTLDLSAFSGIEEYVPGDLTLTARAGTTLAELAEVTAGHGQWLPLDPYGDPRGTLGATLATSSAGPLGGSVGLPRDVTVGVTFVSGRGEVVQGGGRVVKNVAGFDLVRLTIGAWGTLGVITEATVRVRARPEAEETVALKLPAERDALATLLSTIRAAMVEPLAAELLSPVCARRVGLGADGVLLVRLAGNTVGVNDQRATLAKLAATEVVASDVWDRLRASDPDQAVVVRVSRRPTELARLWLTTLSLPGVDAHATMARGLVRLRLTSDARDPLAAFDARDHVVPETAPVAWHGRRARPDASDNLAHRLRDAFDPDRILNRGILGPEGP
jgi:glycolate oxidase FAD binding subunit